MLGKISPKKILVPGVLSLVLLFPVRAFAQDAGLNLADLAVIKLKIEYTKFIVGQLKPYFDNHIGKINTEFINNTFLREQFLAISFFFLVLLLLFEIILVLTEQSKFHTLLPRFITSLVAAVAYLGIITMVIQLANAFMSGLMGGTASFVEFTQLSIDALWVDQDLPSTLLNTIRSLPGIDLSGNKMVASQTILTLDILLALYTVIPIFVGIGQFISDVVINVMIIISPIVAVTHIHGIKSPISRNFWTVFTELVVGKIAFTLAYTFIVNHVTDKVRAATGVLDIGLAIYVLACFLSIGAVTLAIREVFNFGSSFRIGGEIKESSTKPNVYVQNTLNTVSSGLQTIQSLRRGV